MQLLYSFQCRYLIQLIAITTTIAHNRALYAFIFRLLICTRFNAYVNKIILLHWLGRAECAKAIVFHNTGGEVEECCDRAQCTSSVCFCVYDGFARRLQ